MVHLVFITVLLCTVPALNKKYPFRICVFPILFLFLSLRYEYGNDYVAYRDIHILMNQGLPAWGENDILFYNLNLLLPNFFLYIAVTSWFYIISIRYLIKKNLRKDQQWFAIFILLINPYLFLMHSSALRQTLAICFFIYAVNFATKRKIIPYTIFILLAIGMHASAIVLFPLYFILTEKKINKKQELTIVFLVGILLFTPLFNLVITKILLYLPKYQHYFNRATQNSLRSTIINTFYFLLVLLNISKLKGKEIIYGKLSLISTILSLLAFKLSMVGRVAMYFDVFLIVTLPNIFSRLENKNYKKILFLILISIYLLRYYSFFINPMWKSFTNYKIILGK